MEPECDILIVENSLTQALKLQHLLKQHGFRVTIARDGSEALTALETQTPRLVLSETIMPDMDGYQLCRQIKAQKHLQNTAVVLLNSFSDPQDVLRAIECGADDWVGKPYEDQPLLSLLDTVLAHRENPPLPPSTSPDRLLALLLSTYHTAVQRTIELRELHERLELLEEQQQQQETSPPADAGRLRILLAEDSVVNQQFARRTLEKAGYAVTVAGDGRQALAAWETTPFDLVLMDVEMPEMGGLEATGLIRQKELGSNARIPIIAMTAHDAQEDLDRCLAAGMDGYLPKPLQIGALHAVLEKLASPTKPIEEAAPVTVVFDQEDALARVDGDRELLAEILQLFLDEAPALLAQIRQAVAGQDAALLERAAHTLKGAAASISAPTVVSTALRLEAMGRERNFGGSKETTAALEQSLEALTPVLAHFRGS